MAPTIDFYPESDSIQVKLTDSRIVSGRSIDNNRIHLDLDQDRNIIGIAFMDVSRGINLAALPPELLPPDEPEGTSQDS